MLELVKKAVRITNSHFDDELKLEIESCKLDLINSGVAKSLIINENPLIKQAIILYCKANFGFDNQEADRFARSYELLKTSLTFLTDDDFSKESEG